MRREIFNARRALCLLAGGICWLAPAVWADIKLSKVEVDGRPQTVPPDTASATTALKISSTARSIIFYFTESDRDGRPTARLRYKLEGYDKGWRDRGSPMRMIIQFRDHDNINVGAEIFKLQGETPGWRGTIQDSDFQIRRETVVAPARAAKVRVFFTSLPMSEAPAMGLIAVDAVRLRVVHPEDGRTEEHDLSVIPITGLNHPDDSPANWAREGTLHRIAEVGTRPVPTPHPILILNDTDPIRFANWVTYKQSLPVHPGDRLTLEWQNAYSIGDCGPGQADYPRLNPGTYWFHVAAANANGKITDTKASLRLIVVIPFYARLEFWLVIALLVGGALMVTGRVALRRRMQRQIAEYERQHALERERARIARDLHDDIGAGLTEIAMQGDLVLDDLAQRPATEARRRLERLCRFATELARDTDEIVWAVNPTNDTLAHFVNYLTQNTEQFLDAAGLRVRFDIPQQLPELSLSGKVRHYSFLAIREALNNVAKHARANLVRLEISTTDSQLKIAIEDNGCGFTPHQTGAAGTHDGLDNMQRRMEEIGGHFHLTSRLGGGTRIEFFVPLCGKKIMRGSTP